MGSGDEPPKAFLVRKHKIVRTDEDTIALRKEMLRPPPVVSRAVANLPPSSQRGLCVPDGAPVRPH
jgi:hypothetical protein